MKKVVALFSTLLIFAGVKAQQVTPVKKETVKPVPMPPAQVDSLQVVKPGSTPIKQNDKAIKFDHIKKTAPVQMKENNAQLKVATPVTKPHKD